MHRTIAIKSKQLILNVNQSKWRKKKKMLSVLLSCFVILFPICSQASGWQGNAGTRLVVRNQ